MKNLFATVVFATALFVAQNANGQMLYAQTEQTYTELFNSDVSSGCSYDVYNQTSNNKITGEILYYNTCGTTKVAVAYKVYDSNWNYQYTTAGYSTLSYTKDSKRISLSYRENGSKLQLIDWLDCEEGDCYQFIKRYKN
ncbi:MAG: hypothetical protein LBN95_10370 [Prevotellaceae bacterium]|jgi:hypothetical protein|nr:hypothetical protein [Prevotellaceae bacterium]